MQDDAKRSGLDWCLISYSRSRICQSYIDYLKKYFHGPLSISFSFKVAFLEVPALRIWYTNSFTSYWSCNHLLHEKKVKLSSGEWNSGHFRQKDHRKAIVSFGSLSRFRKNSAVPWPFSNWEDCSAANRKVLLLYQLYLSVSLSSGYYILEFSKNLAANIHLDTVVESLHFYATIVLPSVMCLLGLLLVF